MIRPIAAPIEAKYRVPCERTPGRYEGLINFAMKLAGLFWSDLKAWTVLDVGGADGWLGEMLVCHRYWWVDPQAEEVQRHYKWVEGPPPHLVRWRPVHGQGEALPFRTGSVDLVVSKQTLPHFSYPQIACREMLRVARQAVVIRQDWGVKDTDGSLVPIGWPGHSRSQIDHPSDILDILTVRGASTATYDGEDFVARRTR